jgi:hypothetical protein
LLPVKSRGRATVFLAAGWPLGMLIAIGTVSLLRVAGWHWILAVNQGAWGVWDTWTGELYPTDVDLSRGHGNLELLPSRNGIVLN